MLLWWSTLRGLRLFQFLAVSFAAILSMQSPETSNSPQVLGQINTFFPIPVSPLHKYKLGMCRELKIVGVFLISEKKEINQFFSVKLVASLMESNKTSKKCVYSSIGSFLPGFTGAWKVAGVLSPTFLLDSSICLTVPAFLRNEVWVGISLSKRHKVHLWTVQWWKSP